MNLKQVCLTTCYGLVCSNLCVGGQEQGQDWSRPDLPESWNPKEENLIFQQIECDEGTFDRKTTIQLFGVTDVSWAQLSCFFEEALGK